MTHFKGTKTYQKEIIHCTVLFFSVIKVIEIIRYEFEYTHHKKGKIDVLISIYQKKDCDLHTVRVRWLTAVFIVFSPYLR